MGDQRGFMKVKRKDAPYRPVCERLEDFSEVSAPLSPEESARQASRCMDCGTPFCHWGCPVGNFIPEWNDMMFRGDWAGAFGLLNYTNNFPEITGRVCPAPCESACVLGINDDPVAIRENELSIVEKAFDEGMVKPFIPVERTGKKVAIIGSGPAGLACGDQLNKAGHQVTIFEKDDKPGGLLRYGIPEFKLEKKILERRLSLMKEGGVDIVPGVNIGEEVSLEKLLEDNDAVCVAVGAGHPRDIDIEGRDLGGIHFAMEYLTQGNRLALGESLPREKLISAGGKKVVVIGGGDTGSDCVGTANRQKASCVVQLELMPRPGECRSEQHPWPSYPVILKTSSSHEEGVKREWAVLTKKFLGEGGMVARLECVRVEFTREGESACPVMREIPGSEFSIEADLVIIAAGFVHPQLAGLLSNSGIELDEKKNIKTDEKMMTSIGKVFSAGDSRRGQSLIVWAIAEGRRCAYNIDNYLMGRSFLPVV